MEHDVHIQSVAAILQTIFIGLTFFATATSLLFLLRYVRDTNSLANTAQNQLRASFAPCLVLEQDVYIRRTATTRGIPGDPHLHWRITNMGSGTAFNIYLENLDGFPPETSPIAAGGYKAIGTLQDNDGVEAALQRGPVLINYKDIDGNPYQSVCGANSFVHKKL